MKSMTAVLLCLSLFWGISHAFAQTVYVTDEFEVTLRTGPSIENKIIAMLPTGTPLEVSEERGEWLLVRTPSGSDGWVLKRYASPELPKKIVIEQLKKKYDATLKNLERETGKAATIEKENKELRSALKTSQEKLKNVQQEYTRLVSESKDFLKLKQEHSENLARLKKTVMEADRLSKENGELRSSTNIIWFLSGASVVVVSWLIGYVMGKIQRRSRSHSLYR